MTRSGKNAAVVFVNRLTKVVAAKTSIGAEQFAQQFLDIVVTVYGVLETITWEAETGKVYKQALATSPGRDEYLPWKMATNKMNHRDAVQNRLMFAEYNDDEALLPRLIGTSFFHPQQLRIGDQMDGNLPDNDLERRASASVESTLRRNTCVSAFKTAWTWLNNTCNKQHMTGGLSKRTGKGGTWRTKEETRLCYLQGT
jgi:hypothetical protein